MSFSSPFNLLQHTKPEIVMNEDTQKMKILHFPSSRVMTEMNKSAQEADNAAGDSSQLRHKQPL